MLEYVTKLKELLSMLLPSEIGYDIQGCFSVSGYKINM